MRKWILPAAAVAALATVAFDAAPAKAQIIGVGAPPQGYYGTYYGYRSPGFNGTYSPGFNSVSPGYVGPYYTWYPPLNYSYSGYVNGYPSVYTAPPTVFSMASYPAGYGALLGPVYATPYSPMYGGYSSSSYYGGTYYTGYGWR